MTNNFKNFHKKLS